MKYVFNLAYQNGDNHSNFQLSKEKYFSLIRKKFQSIFFIPVTFGDKYDILGYATNIDELEAGKVECEIHWSIVEEDLKNLSSEFCLGYRITNTFSYREDGKIESEEDSEIKFIGFALIAKNSIVEEGDTDGEQDCSETIEGN